MHALTDGDPWRIPQAFLDDAKCGLLTVVAASGKPLVLASPHTNGQPLREALIHSAVQLYDRYVSAWSVWRFSSEAMEQALCAVDDRLP